MRPKALVVVALALAHVTAAEPGLVRLEREIARLAAIGGGVVGATAVHVESGRKATFNGAEPFPMASAYKVPIAVQLLSLVDAGKVRLSDMVTFQPSDLHPGSGTITDLFNKPGLALSVHNLLELMLLISDNSATDVLLRVAGGPAAVTAKMKALGLPGIRVDRPTALLIADAVGIPDLGPESNWTPQNYSKLARMVTPQQRQEAQARFARDPRDTATPDDMAELLVRIHRRELHQAATADLLVDIMRRCRTGENRIPGRLPPQTVLAHKTGTIAQSIIDVGIITLPGDAGHVALAAFVKASERPSADRERAIAEIGRAVHDYFLFHPEGALNYKAMADRIVKSLKPAKNERFLARFDPGYMAPLVPALRERLRQEGVVAFTAFPFVDRATGKGKLPDFAERLSATDVYLDLPYRASSMLLPPDEAAALVAWTAQGGSRRQLHFHWNRGSVLADGLAAPAHPEEYDALYQKALEIDYASLRAAQDKAVALLKSGVVRVTTPAGTDIRFRVGDRPFNLQDGDASAERMKSAKIAIDRDIELPAGVLRVAPLEETVDGTLVIPEARFGGGQSARGIRLTIRKGKVTNRTVRENGAAVQLPDAFREFGLGFNRALAAAPGSNILPYFGYGAGVVRLSLGDNTELGGAVKGGGVRWLFFPDATVSLGTKKLVDQGRLLD